MAGGGAGATGQGWAGMHWKPRRRNAELLHVCTSGRQYKAQKEDWLVSGLQDHGYLSVKRETYRCQWTGHCWAQEAIECSDTSLTVAKHLLLDLPVNNC